MNETLKRSISGAIYILLLIASILYSKESFIILFGVFLIIATFEFGNLVKINKFIAIISAFLIYTTIILISFYRKNTETWLATMRENNPLVNFDIEQLDLALLVITLLVSIKCMVFLFENSFNDLNTFSKYIYLLGYIIFPFVFICKISIGINDYNPKIIIGLFILIWTNDTFAYLVGKSMGKHKLFERISPKKTIEGFIGGVVFAVFAGFLISKLYIQPKPEFSEKSILIWITIAIIAGFFGTIGDLIESKFKRVAGVKDSGIIMPGHGGILDRFDSVIFVAPIVFLFYKILNFI